MRVNKQKRSTTTAFATLLGTFFLLYVIGLPLRVSAESFTTIRNNGDPLRRVDMAILGDGYTAAEMSKYAADVETFVQSFFSQEPFKEYQRYFNVHRVDVISAESGADHPEFNPPIFKNTALGASYGCGVDRCICVDTTTVCNVLNNTLQPAQYDILLILVNDPTYGGCSPFGTCGQGTRLATAYTPRNQAGGLDPTVAVEVIAHELGHSFGLLADEYCSGPCFPGEPPEPNVTAATDRNSTKWNYWIDANTVVPTLIGNECIPQQGIIERYKSTTSTDGGFALRLVGDKVQFWTLRNGGEGDFITGSTAVGEGGVGPNNGWHHVAGVFDGQHLNIYLDGTLDASKNSTFAPSAGTETLKIGARGDDATFTFNGLIDEVRLTPSVVYTGNFTPQKQLSALSGTVGLWKFNDQTINDSSGFGNNGVTVNGATFSSITPKGNSGNYSLALNGVGAYARVSDSNSLDIIGPFTAEAWIRITPTTAPPSIPGLYQGARYCPTGLYRPTFSSKMRSLGSPFDQINTEQLVKRIYNTIGTPIDASSPPGTSINVPSGQIQAFSATTPVPFTHTLSITWFVDGQQQATGASFNLNTSTLTTGLHIVDAFVQDPTSWVRYDPDQLLTEHRTWSVNVTGGGQPSLFSLSLNGAGAYVNVPNSTTLNITGAITVEAWIKTNAANTQQGIIERYGLSGIGTTDGGYALRLSGNNTVQFFTLKNGNEFDSIESDITITVGDWHHIAGVFNQGGSRLQIYVDGQQHGDKPSTFAPYTGTNSVKIGARGDNAAATFNGLIDEARVTAAALYTTDFTPLAQLSAATGTKGLWKFDSQNANDTSGNNNNGSLVGGATFSTNVPQ